MVVLSFVPFILFCVCFSPVIFCLFNILFFLLSLFVCAYSVLYVVIFIVLIQAKFVDHFSPLMGHLSIEFSVEGGVV